MSIRSCRGLVSLVLVGCGLALPTVARAQQAPMGAHYATRSSDTGHDGVGPNQNGGFTPALPLDLPPARGGLPIPLQVVSGSRGFGAAGLGWDVPLSYVLFDHSFAHRRPAYAPGQPASPRERITVALPGRQAEMVPQGQDGTHWIGRDAPDLTLEYDADSESYKAYDGNGLTYVFTQQPLLAGTGGTSPGGGLWLLDSILGQGHASLKLTYDVDVVDMPGSPAISIDLYRIQYDSHPSANDCYKTEIDLNYEPDLIEDEPRTLVVLGAVLTGRKHKLASIDVLSRPACGAALERVRQYALTYATDPDTQEPRLSSVAVSGRSGTPEGNLSIPIVSYDYGTATVSDGAGGRKLQYVETDPIAVPSDADEAGDGYIASTEQVTSSSEQMFGLPTYVSRLSFTDFTGDGRPDLVFSKNGQLMIARNVAAQGGATMLLPPVPFTDGTFTGHSIDVRTTNIPRFASASLDAIRAEQVWREVIDFNGDGRPDIVDAAEQVGHWVVYLNKPSSGPSRIEWVRRVYDISALKDELRTYQLAVPQTYLPLSTRVTGATHTTRTCWEKVSATEMAVTSDSNCPGNIDMNGIIAPSGYVISHELEKTYQEYDLRDANGDGYPDFIFDASPVTWGFASPSASDMQNRYTVYDTSYAFQIKGYYSSIRIAYNIAGVVAHSNATAATAATDPFSHSQEFYWDTFGGGIARWTSDTRTYSIPASVYQLLECSFVDVNGDGILDRVEGTSGQRILLGTGSGFYEVEWHLPDGYQVSSQRSEYQEHCEKKNPDDPDEPPPDYHPYTSYEQTGLRDLSGDGIPDLIGRNASWIGTGTGAVPVGGTRIPSAVDEDCDGWGSHTSQGYFDIDGDGKPEWIQRAQVGAGWEFRVWKLESTGALGAPEAGRIVSVNNGAGAVTSIAYRSAKDDATTLHQVPFPEVVVSHTETLDPNHYVLLARKNYAYGNISMFYDSTLDVFRPTGYLRSVEVTTSQSPSEPDKPHGVAQVVDRFPLEAFNVALNDTGRFLRYARVGQVSDVTTLVVADNTDPWTLLTDQLSGDLRRSAGSHVDLDARVSSDQVSLAVDCLDIMDPFDFEGSQSNNFASYSPCFSHGFTYPSRTSSWRGSSAPPMSGNVETRSSITDVDNLGRPTSIFEENDAHRGDDDICIDIKYASPASADLHAPSVVSSRTVSDCTKAGGAVHIYSSETSLYDGFAFGQVAEGLLTSRSVHSYTTDDTNQDQGTVSEDVEYDAAANPVLVHMHRADGAERSTTLRYDEFGLAPLHVSVEATGVPTLTVDNTVDPVTGKLLASTDANGTTRGTVFDGFERPIYETVETPDKKTGVLKAWNYAGFDAPDANGRRVEFESFTDPVAKDDVPSAKGRRSTIYLDELARPRRTEVELGEDYGSEVLVVGDRSFDDLGRVVFQADPYAKSQGATTAYGTTRYFNSDGSLHVEIRGRGRQAFTTSVDESLERYPTIVTHGFDNFQETTVTQTPDSLVASPQSGVQHQSVSTATGLVLSRATWKGGTRLEYEQLAYDRLGQLVTMSRYKDPAAAANPVTTTWVLDSQGRVVKLREPSSAEQTRFYDDWGELQRIEWTPQSQPVHDVQYSYDAFGRLTHSEERNGGVIDKESVYDYGYDKALTSPIVENEYTLGRLAYARGPAEEIRFGYDTLGSVSARTYLDSDGSVYVDQAGYHADGSQAWLELYLPDTSYQPERMDYEYDTAGRLRWMWYSDGINTQDVFDASKVDAWGRLREATFGLATYSANFADTGRRLPKSVKVSGAGDSRSFDYGPVDPVGRELSRVYNLRTFAGTETLAYNALGQLSTSKRVQGSTITSQWGFAYDPLGNATGLSDVVGTADATLSYAATGDLDRICRIGYGNGGLGGSTCNVDYDSFGNVITEPTRTGTNVLTYLNSGSVRSISSSGGVSAAFSYDPFGQLGVLDIKKGGAQLREDRHHGGLITKRLQSSSTGTADYILRQFPGPGVQISRRGKEGPWVYEFSEPKGVRFTVDEAGKFVQDVDYAPFGEASTKGANPGDPRFTTEQWNDGDGLDALGLVQVGARIYDPVIGRFLSRDPLIVPRTASAANPYSFALNDPVNLSDPTGMYANCTGCSLWASYSYTSGELGTIAALGFWAAELAFGWGTTPPQVTFNYKSQWTAYFGAYFSRSQQLQADHDGEISRQVALQADSPVDPGPAFCWSCYGSDTAGAIRAAIEVEKVNGTYEGDVEGAMAAEWKAPLGLVPGVNTGRAIANGDVKGATVNGALDLFALFGGEFASLFRFGGSTVVDEGAHVVAGGTTEVTAAGIRAINRSLGGTVELTGKAETVIANMAYREGATARAATAIRDIAGRHLFDDANKRTAQAVAERLLGSGANPSQIRSVIDQVATGGLRTVEDIAAALVP